MEKEEWKGKIEDSFLHPVLQNSGSSMEMLQVLYGDVPGTAMGWEEVKLQLWLSAPLEGSTFICFLILVHVGFGGKKRSLG